MTRGVSGFALRAAIACVAFLATFVISEVAVRAVGHARGTSHAERVFDARYGEVPRDSWIFDFRIDPARHHAVDLHGQVVPLVKPAGETRVLFVGDSATEGAFVAPEEAYPRVFERLVAERTRTDDVRVVNAGVWGMTTLDEYHLLRDKLLPLDPDVVVVGLFMANDINFNLLHTERRRADRGVSWIDAVRSRSALGDFLFSSMLGLNQRWQLVDARHESASWIPVEFGLVDELGLHLASYPEGELATYLRRPSALMDHAFDVLREALRSLQRLGAEHDFRVRVLLIPSPSAVAGRLAILAHPDILGDLGARGIALTRGDLDVDSPTRRVLAICDELDLACVDPTARMKRLGARAFFAHDEHPTAAGHRVLAEALLAD